MPFSPPASILIIGSGVFGLSTALSLSRRSQYAQSTITVLDRSPFPSPDGSSIDTSRIIRADYSSPAYAALATRAQKEWRKTGPGELGGDGRYTESGLVLVANTGRQGEEYVKNSWENAQQRMKQNNDLDGVTELPNKEAIEAAVGTGGTNGDWGYINRRSGWADAEASMRWLRQRVEATHRVTFLHGEATHLLKTTTSTSNNQTVVHGAQLHDGRTLHADLVILATGAWTGKLVDLRGRATATGQVLAYVELTAAEQARLQNMPVLLNMSTGLFIIPPRDRVLKIARHAYGYLNPVDIPNPDDEGSSAPRSEGENQACGRQQDSGREVITVSLPRTQRDDPALQVPAEGLTACREALRSMTPSLGERPFSRSRVCWYTDTPAGDFLISYHPRFGGLFLATGASGHGFKFLSVIGDCIVDCVEGRCPLDFRDRWKWPDEGVESVVTEDGSRGGPPGLILDEELKKGSKP